MSIVALRKKKPAILGWAKKAVDMVALWLVRWVTSEHWRRAGFWSAWEATATPGFNHEYRIDMGKKYSRLLKNRISLLARQNMKQLSFEEKIGRRGPTTQFSIMVGMVEDGDADDQALLRYFKRAKLNHRDAFQWWELLHTFVTVHSNKPPGAHRIWSPRFERKLIADCIDVARGERLSILKICERLKDEKGYRQTPENLQLQISRKKLTSKIKDKIALSTRAR